MTTSFVKTEVGQKQFVIEWYLEVNDNEVDGEPFELEDCELVSLQSIRQVISGSPAPKLYATNYADSSVFGWYGEAVSLLPGGGGNSLILPYEGDLFPLAATRFVFPRLEGNGAEGSVRVAALFREI